MKRRDVLATGIASALLPIIGRTATPCPPDTISVDGNTVTGSCDVEPPPTGGAIAHGGAVTITRFRVRLATSCQRSTTISVVASIGSHIAGVPARVGNWDSPDAGAGAAPVYSTARSRGAHGRCADHNFPSFQVNGACALAKNVALNNGQTAFFDWWLNTDAYNGDNYKILRWYGSNGDNLPEMNWVYGFAPGNNILRAIPVDAGGSMQTVYDSSPSVPLSSNTWKHYQCIQRAGTTVATDRFIGVVNGVTVNDITGKSRASASNRWQDWRMGYYQHGPYAHVYTSSVFMSFGEKRVEATNNANYNAPGAIREIQPHDSWSDGTIHIPRFNKGMLPAGPVWLHVVLSGFTASFSKSITVA